VKQKALKAVPETGECAASQAEIAKALAGDQGYLRTMYLYNMENVLTELSAFLLALCYGSLTPNTAFAILKKQDLQAWCSRGFAYSQEDEDVYVSDGALLRPLYEFLRWQLGKTTSLRPRRDRGIAPTEVISRQASQHHRNAASTD